MAEAPTGPIFVAGADRSGTTLMTGLLASHSGIAAPRLGSNMWTFFAGRFGSLANDANLARLLAALLRYRNALQFEPDLDRLRAAFRAGPPDESRLFMLIEDQWLERQGKRRWADKTSYIEQFADPIFAARPDARFVHMVRDPRDRFTSAIRKWPAGRGQLGGATARWRTSVRLAERNLARYPGRYLVVRFESLVADPEGTLREVCAFLGEPFEPAMLGLEGAEAFRRRGGNSSFDTLDPGAISTGPVGRYRSVLRPAEIRFIQLFTRRGMALFGYHRDRVALSPGALLRFALWRLPVDAARLFAWPLLDSLQRRFPTRLGRSPASRRMVGGEAEVEGEGAGGSA